MARFHMFDIARSQLVTATEIFFNRRNFSGVEARLSAAFEADDEKWTHATTLARQAVEEADATLARICAENGIPDRFRPRIVANWYSRGETADPKRRAELRTLARARVDASRQEGYHLIEKWQAEAQTRILTGTLESDAAKAFLDAMPSAESLLLDFTAAQLDALATPPGLRLIPGADRNGTDD